MTLISRLQTEPVRTAFPNEARDFTPWLEGNIEALGERLGITLTVIQREKAVGDFNVDLWCEDDGGRAVIIENQLDPTNHDHLGKVLTYLVNLNAVTAIWITSEGRAEHRRVVDWLNESTPDDISVYLVRVEAVRMGESILAPLFTVVSAPDSQSKRTGEEKKEWAERHRLRFEFWKSLLERSRGETQLFAGISPQRSNWIAVGAGKAGFAFSHVIRMDRAQVELYIDIGDSDKNKAAFDALYRQRDAIEAQFGDALDWQRLDDKRACRIAKVVASTGLTDSEHWPAIQDAMIDAMIRLDKAFRKRLATINTQGT